VLFIIYGMLGHIYPVFFLHITLLPINLIKVYQTPHRRRKIANRRAGGLAELIGKLDNARVLLRKVKRWRRQARRRLPLRRTLMTKDAPGKLGNVAAEAGLANLL
jgi:hypothetical protein